MAEEFSVTPLFGGTSLSTPRAPRPPVQQPQRSGDALATALLTGMLTDLAALKDQMRQQGELNRSFHDWAGSQQAFNESLAQADRQQVEVNGHQAESNTAQNALNREVATLIGKHNELN